MFKKIDVIPYTLKRYKKSKSIRLRIRSNGEVFVTAPYLIPIKYINTFIQEKAPWIQAQLDLIESLPQPHIKTQKGDYKKYKEQARKLVQEKISKINAYYNFSFKRIAIKDQKSRWGSCSNKKNLNFNYKLIFIPDILAEYIVIHELCHLKEMNHGEKFWELVSKTMPDYKKRRKELADFKIN